jgi:hypothetical protein
MDNLKYDNSLDITPVTNPKILILNEAQTKAVKALKSYLANTTKYNFLLLGAAGSGKTTVITNAFDSTKLRVAFCAFTNKATQVLKTVSEKFNISFKADFSTIHKLLMLEPKYAANEFEVAFKFDKTKVEHLKNYDVIIFDECSTISKELYSYIRQAFEWIDFKLQHKIKFIFLGDYWQLPPVGEETSVIFDTAIKEKWNVSKLIAVMRSANDKILDINHSLLSWIDIFRNPLHLGNKDLLDDFHLDYPYNLISRDDHRDIYINDLDDMLDLYMEEWRTKEQNDIVILTYSKANCEKINFSVQDKIDLLAKRELPETRRLVSFHEGDRCCLDKPIEICTIVRNLDKETSVEYITLDAHTNEFLYNGEIFDIIYAENIKIKTPLNKFAYNPRYFDGQLLKVRRINDQFANVYEIVHIDEKLITTAKNKVRAKTSRDFYLNIMTGFIKVFPKLDYGYCITVYKSQGSEWHTVLINLNSVKWSIVGDHRDKSNRIDLRKKKGLFKTTYTAISRASHNVKLFWY